MKYRKRTNYKRDKRRFRRGMKKRSRTNKTSMRNMLARGGYRY